MMMKALALFLVAAALVGQEPVFKVDTRLVILNVSVRDKNNSPVIGLSKEVFEVLEDGIPQAISVFEPQDLESDTLADRRPKAPAVPMQGETGRRQDNSRSTPLLRSRFQNHRLIVLLFDRTAMAAADQARALRAARSFIQSGMTISDLISIMVLNDDALDIVSDFTDDQDSLLRSLNGLGIGGTQTVWRSGSWGGGKSFNPDDSDFKVLTTDRRLAALESALRTLGAYAERKALVYFSSGMARTGIDNLNQLRATVNAARRSNVSVYAIDARGLVALPPGGDASQPSQSGTGILTGAQQQSVAESLNTSQQSLFTLSADTGGRAFLDSNDLTPGIRQVQHDIVSYYAIGYYSTNAVEDGNYRNVRVLLNDNGFQAKLEYRTGYYAQKKFELLTPADRERQLKAVLTRDNTLNDVPLAVEVDFFRIGRNRYFVPIFVRMPISAVLPGDTGGQQSANLDFYSEVYDRTKTLAGSVRDNISIDLTSSASSSVGSSQLLYNTGLTLTSGTYRLLLAARENGTGKIGTFETRFTVPDLPSAEGPRISSVVLGGQRVPVSYAAGAVDNRASLQNLNPLVQDGLRILPNILRVFHSEQTLYAYLELYDSGSSPELDGRGLAAELALILGTQQVRTSQPVRLERLERSKQDVVRFRFEIPLAGLQAGDYTVQLTVIDQLRRKFAFRRDSIHLLR